MSQAKSQQSATPSGGGDGWDFGDDEDLDISAPTTRTAAAGAGGVASSTTTAAGAPEPARTGSGRASDDDRVDSEEVGRLRARLASLRDLLDTFLAVDGVGVQGVAFDVGRLREFLALASCPGESRGEQMRSPKGAIFVVVFCYDYGAGCILPCCFCSEMYV